MNSIANVLKHLLGRRGLLLLGTLLAGLVALPMTDGIWARMFAAAAFLMLWALVLTISLRLSPLHSQLRSVRLRGPATQEIQQLSGPVIDGVTTEQLDLVSSLDMLSLCWDFEAEQAVPPAPAITVFVPSCYNEARFAEEALLSLRLQSFKDWECMFVDDALADGSLSVIWRMAAEDESFRVVLHRVNSSLGGLPQHGSALAR